MRRRWTCQISITRPSSWRSENRSNSRRQSSYRHDLPTAAAPADLTLQQPDVLAAALARQTRKQKLGRFPFDFEGKPIAADPVRVAPQQVSAWVAFFAFQKPAD